MRFPFCTGGKTFVLWDVEVCPIPDGLGPHDVFSNIKRVLMDNGYSGDVSTTPYTDLTKSNGEFNGIPVRHLSAGEFLTLSIKLSFSFKLVCLVS